MDRKFLDFLQSRSPRSRRVPLMVRGARQVGKSHTINQYGATSFEHLVEVNLELNPSYKNCFESLDPTRICRDLEVLCKKKLTDGKSLLFIDEIQDCPEAILSLRAFKEQRPGLDVIAAGSLLEFALDDTTIRSFPVGRVSFAWMHPMSFTEFLRAMGEDGLLDILSKATLTKASLTEGANGASATGFSAAIHNQLLEWVRVYFVVGGLPEVVDVYRETRSYIDARQVQTRLALGYVADFVKYGRHYDYRKLQTILSAIPRLVGKPLKFSQIADNVRARDLKAPLFDLEKSGLIRLVRATSANGAPLSAEERDGVYKPLMLDIGLMLNMLGLDLGVQSINEALFANEGALAEQFVGQEFLANATPDIAPGLHYWHRGVKSSEAEVDFVIARNGVITPVEVKAGNTGSLRSARLFMKEKGRRLAVRISQHGLSLHDGILSVPFYMCSEIPRLLDEAEHF